MCGIVGYAGDKDATPILINSIKKLEYRGYDSAGVGIISRRIGKIVYRKTKGKIQDLTCLIQKNKLPVGNVGISHTRWATHGKPNRANAHPHSDSSGNILLVHNGIIENYQELKKSLIKKGHEFSSETDTEVIAHLIGDSYKGELLTAVKKSVKQLKGSFALGVLCRDHPDTLIGVRMGSPLIVGLGKNENYIASDVPAILDRTKKVIYLHEGQIAVLKKTGVKIFDFNGKQSSPKIDTVTFKIGSAQKEGFAHFMLKEIHEQPKVINNMLSSRVDKNSIKLDGINMSDKKLKKIKNIIVVACGTAYHAGMVGKYIIERFSKTPVAVDLSSEFRYRSPIIEKTTLVVAISQSGETADTLAAIREAKKKGAKIISVVNVVGSSLARESDGVLYTHAGPEIGVASTKAYTAQLAMLYLFAIKLGVVKRNIKPALFKKIIKNLRRVPGLLNEVLREKNRIAKIARVNSHFGCFLFLGRNINFPSALEGALKLKEISYIPAEGYAAGEMKHGPIALIDEYRAVVCVAPQSDVYEKMISNMQEIRARRGKIIAIATKGDDTITHHANNVVAIPKCNELLTPIIVALPLQLIAYYIATKRGCDVDQPRNLAKSVTVE